MQPYNLNDNKGILFTLSNPSALLKDEKYLAQNDNSIFGKVIEVNKKSLNNLELEYKIFSKGHRNPQGLTKLNNKIFSVEHGPKGGDELNLIENNKNFKIKDLINYSIKLYEEQSFKFTNKLVEKEVADFLLERLKYYMKEKNMRADIIDVSLNYFGINQRTNIYKKSIACL